MRPPISYYGGKQSMSLKIIPLIPKHAVYVEPFAGGAAVLFGKPVPDVPIGHYREVINDTHGELVNFYRVLREDGEALVSLLQLTPHAREEYAECKTPYDESLTPLERARRFFYMINNSYAKKENGGWAYSKKSRNEPLTFLNKVNRLPAIVGRFKRAYIEHKDALEVIKTWDCPEAFFYCDPPYIDTEQGHYDGYTADDLNALFELLLTIDGAWMVSGYCAPPGVELPDDVEVFSFDAYGAAAGYSKKANIEKKGKKRTELVFRRKAQGALRADVQKRFDAGKYDCFKG